MHDKYQRQKRISGENTDKILTIIQGRKKTDPKGIVIDGATFTEIQKETLLSPAGLTKILQRLETEDTIEKILIKKEIVLEEEEVLIGKGGAEIKPAKKFTKGMKPVYILTEKGQAYYKGIWQLMYELLELKEKNAGYMHSLSSNYYNFGLSHDIIMSGKDRQLTFMMPSIPQIEDFIMAEMFKNIKEKGLKLEPSEGKILSSFEIDFEKFASEIIGIQTFIEDIKNDKDVFADERLYLSTTPNRLWVLDYLIGYSLFFGDQTFRTHLTSYLQKLSNKTNFTATFGEIDFEFVEKFVRLIIDNKEPLDNKRMLKRLIIKGQGTSVELPLFAYVKVAKVMNFGKNEVYSKLCAYENEKNNDNYNPNSKLQTLIKEVRGNAK